MEIKHVFYGITLLGIMNSIIHTMSVNKQLFEAAGNGSIRRVNELLAQDADPNAEDYYERTPLHYATKAGHMITVRLLLAHNARPNVSDCHGETPLHVAVKYNHWEIARLLLEHNARPNALCWDDWTPLHMAVFNNCTEIARLLLAYKADPNDSSDHYNRTPLSLAATKGHTEIAKLLLVEHKVDPNISDHRGWTPLHQAAFEGHTEIVKLLLEHKADPSALDNTSETPLHLTNDKEILAMLLRAGANIPDNLPPEKVALLDEVTEEINAIITQQNIAGFLNLHKRKIQPAAEILLSLAKLRLPSEILRSRREAERLRLQQKAF